MPYINRESASVSALSLSDPLVPVITFSRLSMRAPERRIDDRIRNLCAQATAASYADQAPNLARAAGTCSSEDGRSEAAGCKASAQG